MQPEPRAGNGGRDISANNQRPDAEGVTSPKVRAGSDANEHDHNDDRRQTMGTLKKGDRAIYDLVVMVDGVGEDGRVYAHPIYNKPNPVGSDWYEPERLTLSVVVNGHDRPVDVDPKLRSVLDAMGRTFEALGLAVEALRMADLYLDGFVWVTEPEFSELEAIKAKSKHVQAAYEALRG